MKKLKERWNALDEELKNYFFGKSILLGFFLVITVLAYFFVYTKSLATLFLVIFLFYGGWIFYQFVEGILGNIYLYEGVCVKKDEKKFDVNIGKRAAPIYGRTTAVIRVKDEGEGSEDGYANLIIPVGFSYDIQKGYTVKAYGAKNGLIMKNPNTFTLPNPILIRVAKTSFDEDDGKKE